MSFHSLSPTARQRHELELLRRETRRLRWFQRLLHLVLTCGCLAVLAHLLSLHFPETWESLRSQVQSLISQQPEVRP